MVFLEAEVVNVHLHLGGLCFQTPSLVNQNLGYIISRTCQSICGNGLIDQECTGTGLCHGF